LITGTSQSCMLRVWDVATRKEVRQGPCGDSGGFGGAFSADGYTIAAGHRDGTMRLWDASTWQEKRQFAAQPQPARMVAVLPGGKIVISGNGDETIRWWDAETGQEARPPIQGIRLMHLRQPVLSPDGKTLAWASTQVLYLWKA